MMVQDTLSVDEFHQLEPADLLEDVLQDDATYRLIDDVIRRFRARYFVHERGHEKATIDPDASTNRVVEELAWEGFTPNWLLSYHYEGEVANLVRFHYDPMRYPDLPFRQLHVRLFDDGSLEAHEEASALMHKGPHLREESFDREAGTAAVERILADAGIEYDLL